MPFIRILSHEHGRIKKEVLYNTDHITKIEVEYGVPSSDPEDTNLVHVDAETGIDSEKAVRCYRVFFGSEKILLIASPDDPVTKIIEGIYHNAVKG